MCSKFVYFYNNYFKNYTYNVLSNIMYDLKKYPKNEIKSQVAFQFFKIIQIERKEREQHSAVSKIKESNLLSRL